MQCIFCKHNLLKKDITSYYDLIMFCLNCPYYYYNYDDNMAFSTEKYELHYYGKNNFKIFESNSIVIKNNNKIIYDNQLQDISKDFIINFFEQCKNEDEINLKIEQILLFS